MSRWLAGRWFEGLCVAVALGAGILAARVASSPGNFWLTILWAVWIVAVVWTLTRRPFSLLFAAIMGAMFLLVIFPATDAQLFGQTTMDGVDYQAGVARAVEIAALAQCGMLAGAVAARTLWPAAGFRQLAPRLSPARLDRVAWRSVGAGILGVAAFSVLGGVSLQSFFVYTTAAGYGSFEAAATGNLAYLAALQCVAGLALALLPLRWRLGSSRFLPVLLAVLATLVLLGGGQRGRFFAPVFAAGLIWLKTSKRTPRPRQLAAAGAIVLVVLGGLIGVARGAKESRDVTLGTVLSQPFGSGNDLFLPLAGMTSLVPSQFPYLGGSSYLQVAVFPIPRTLWSGKPQDTIVQLTRDFDNNAGFAVPEFGEMYANFGLTGVLLGSLIFGALIEFLALRFARSTSIRGSVFIAVCSAVLLEIFTRGAIAPILTTYEPLLLATALVCSRRSPALAPEPAPASPLPASPKKARYPVATL